MSERHICDALLSLMNPKERHYWAQLRTALTAGQWRTHSPAKTPNGAPLSWSELFRKFNKHCRGAQDVANVASHTYTLALSISEDSLNEDEDNGVPTLGIDTECLISQERVEKIAEGYEDLQSLESSNLDVSTHHSIHDFSVLTIPSIDDPFRSSILRLRSRKSSSMYRSSRKST